jgi:hypothetical protein
VTEEIKLNILHTLTSNIRKIDFTEFLRIWAIFDVHTDAEDEDTINYDYGKPEIFI